MALQDVLVVGTGGCVEYQLVTALFDRGLCKSCHMFDWDRTQNKVLKEEYHKGSLASPSDLASVLSKVKPTVIFHGASPDAATNKDDEKAPFCTTLQGTKNLLHAAREAPSVRAFVYASTLEIVQPPCDLATEDAPLITRPSDESPNADEEVFLQVLADAAVREANDPHGMRTVVLRLAPSYGRRDLQTVPHLLQVLDECGSRPQFEVGDPLVDFVSSTNAGAAHILAAEALLRDKPEDPRLRVDGEAFNITDGRPIRFWSFAQKVWWWAGTTDVPDVVWPYARWQARTMATAMEWAYWIFTLGRRRPKPFTSAAVRAATAPHTFSIAKARERLGYEPIVDRDWQIENAVSWYLGRHPRKVRLFVSVRGRADLRLDPERSRRKSGH